MVGWGILEWSLDIMRVNEAEGGGSGLGFDGQEPKEDQTQCRLGEREVLLGDVGW